MEKEDKIDTRKKNRMILEGLIDTEDMKGLLKAGILFNNGKNQIRGHRDLQEQNHEEGQREGASISEQKMEKSITQKLYNVINEVM